MTGNICPECGSAVDDLGEGMTIHRTEFSPCVLVGHGIRCPHGPVIYHDEGMPYCPDCDHEAAIAQNASTEAPEPQEGGR